MLKRHSLNICVGAIVALLGQSVFAGNEVKEETSNLVAGSVAATSSSAASAVANVKVAADFSAKAAGKINKVFELSAQEGSSYCSTLNKSIKDLPKYTFDISSIVAMLRSPCVEYQASLERLKEQQAQMSGALGPINGLTLIASTTPQGAMELATFYSHLFSNVFTTQDNAPKVDSSDLILYQSLYKKLKLHTTDVLLKNLAHVYITKEAINSLRPERKTAVGKLNDLKTIKDLNAIANEMESYLSSYHARLAVNHMRLSYALENLEQFENVRTNFDLLIPVILESNDAQSPFYKKTLTKAQCSFMQSYAPGSWENQRTALQIKCE